MGRTRLSLWPHGAGLICGGITTLSMWLTWFRSGSAGRNSFGAFRAAQLLDLDFIEPFRVLWFMLPVWFIAASFVWIFGHLRLGALMLAAFGVVVGASGAFAVVSNGPEVGSVIAGAAGSATAIASLFGFRTSSTKSNSGAA